jgi:hypothetical protein
MTVRDLYDIARTIIGRYINAAILQVEYLYVTHAPIESIACVMTTGESLLETLAELLGSHGDYSLYESLCKLEAVTETNPSFECTLKENAECRYCRAYIYENTKYLYLPEMKLLFSEIIKAIVSNTEIDTQAVTNGAAAIRKNYFGIPLKDMKKEVLSFQDTVCRAAKLIDKLSV